MDVNFDNANALDSYIMSPKVLLWTKACRLDYDQYNSILSSDRELCNVQKKNLTRNDMCIRISYGSTCERCA